MYWPEMNDAPPTLNPPSFLHGRLTQHAPYATISVAINEFSARRQRIVMQVTETLHCCSYICSKQSLITNINNYTVINTHLNYFRQYITKHLLKWNRLFDWRAQLVLCTASTLVCLLLNGTSALFRPLVPRIVEIEHTNHVKNDLK